MALQQSKELDQLFTTCLQRTFPSQDVNQVRRSCTRLANLCSYSGTTFVASKHWLSEFKERQKALGKEANAEKEAKKKAKKEKKQQQKAQKKQKKQEKEAKKKAKKAQKKADKKSGKKGGKKDKKDKKSKKEQKKAKKAEKEAKKKAKKEKEKQEKKAKNEAKKQKKAKKDAEKQAKKEAYKNMSEEQKADLKAKKKAEKSEKKKTKKQKKKQEKKEKKAKKFQKKAGKVGKKLLKQENALEKKQQKIAKKVAGLLDKTATPEKIKGPVDVEKRLAVIRDTLNRRDRSISRYATCLAFVSEDKVKDAVDAQCVALKKASEFAFKAEQCWARYLDVLSQCKAQTNKKKCYKALGGLDSVCGDLETQGKNQLRNVFGKESAEIK